jgi:hypothetical protein
VDGSGGITIGMDPGYTDGYQPGFINIENLQIQNVYDGNSPNTFTDYNGSTATYQNGAAGIYLERADHIDIQGCTITNNGEGIFGAGQGSFGWLMTNITLDGNSLYNNGEVGSDFVHGTYLEAIDTVYEYNNYGPMRAGSAGAAIKDRGIGTVIKYNYIDGGSHQLELPSRNTVRNMYSGMS